MAKLDQFEIEVPEGSVIELGNTATGLQVLQDELHKRKGYAEFVKLFLGGDPFLKTFQDRPEQDTVLPPPGMSVVPIWDTSDDVVTEIQTRKPELTESQKRMGLRNRRFIDQPEWTDWD